MTPITYALNHVRKVIPPQILEKAFLSTWKYNNLVPVSVDRRIREEVIDQRVMIDCNLLGGTEIWVRLNGLTRENPDAWTWIYRIPKVLTQGRSIVAALSVSFGEGAVVGATNLLPVRGNSLLDAGAGLLNSSNPIPMIATAKVHLIGDNVVLISDNMALPTNIFLRCWVENDTEMTNLNPRSFRAFAKLVEYAVKSYIYNELVVTMDIGELYAGNQLGRFKEIVDSYEEAEEMYMTHLNEVMGKVLILNDPEAQRRHVQLLVGGLW
jgi:hypothetical protein